MLPASRLARAIMLLAVVLVVLSLILSAVRFPL
jgi:hypothetical protein